MDSKRKIGRNDPCPCGSGKKYKNCHGSHQKKTVFQNPLNDPDVRRKLEEMKALETQRVKQQGLGRSIISNVFKGYRLVAVGNRFYYSKNWRTFHDFLGDYIKFAFGKEWGRSELSKNIHDRHPIFQWIDYICKYRQKVLEKDGQFLSAPMTGAVFAYLTLSYNLYLLAHNIKVQSHLIQRLKNKTLFYGAYYETIVAATFIKAGFKLELEKEDDFSRTHCEFTATSGKTRKRYSIEAKTRRPKKLKFTIRNQLHKALKKQADHERVVFIDLNVPENIDHNEKINWLQDVLSNLRSCENTLTVHNKPSPEAYVFVTNHPFLCNLDSFKFAPAAVVEGFKIPDLKIDSEFSNLRDALRSREKHVDMLDLLNAMKEYDEIPCTWDGDIPEYAFGEIKEPRLKIGNKYKVPDGSGKEAIGELEDAAVLENEKLVYGVYRLENGKRIIATCPMSEKELQTHRLYPDTFFGVHRQKNRKATDALDLYDFFYDTYRKSSKEKLLEFLEGHPNFDHLREQSQEELAKTYCEMLVYSAMRLH